MREPSAWENAVEWLRLNPKQDLVLNAYYDDPVIAAARRYWNSCEWEKSESSLVPPGDRRSMWGPAEGLRATRLAREGFAVTALEPDGSRLVGAGAIRSLAEESALPITVVQEFSEHLPFDDCQFDIAFARAVLHHTQQLTLGLQRILPCPQARRSADRCS